MLDNDRLSLANRLREALRGSGVTNAQIAERCGVSIQAVTGWLRDGKIAMRHIPTIAAETGTDIEWLMSGHQGKGRTDLSSPPNAKPSARRVVLWESPEDLPEGKYVFVPRSLARLSAGSGEIVFDEEIGPPLPFETAWVKANGLYGTALMLVDAAGDSMEPTINDGDMVLVHTRIGDDFEDGKVYAIRYNNELRVKRLFHRYDGGIVIRSDNHGRYPDEPVPPDSLEHIQILGRVVWAAGSVD